MYASHVISGYTCIEKGHIGICLVYSATEHACAILAIFLKSLVFNPYFSMSVLIIYSVTAIAVSFITIQSIRTIQRNLVKQVGQGRTYLCVRMSFLLVLHTAYPKCPLNFQVSPTSRRTVCKMKRRARQNVPSVWTLCIPMPRPQSVDAATTTICGHVFHTACIQQWLQTDNKCPLYTVSHNPDAMKKRPNKSSCSQIHSYIIFTNTYIIVFEILPHRPPITLPHRTRRA